jgi:lipopolysaccharide heptosyltransferase II
MSWSHSRRILAVRLDALGDVLMTTPALDALQRLGDGVEVSLLTSTAGAEAAPLLPMVSEVIVYDASWLKAQPASGSPPDAAMIERLRAGGFDAAAIFTVYTQSALPAALLCHLAGIPLRLAHCRENPYRLLTDWVADPEPDRVVRHEVRRQLDLVAAVGAEATDRPLTAFVPQVARRRAPTLLAECGLSLEAPWVLVHPGASASSRRYPEERFAELTSALARRGLQVVFSGSFSEVELVERIRRSAEVPSLSVAGKLTVAELAAVVERAPVLVSNNTAPVHLAAALQTPVVVLYALTNPQHSPWMVPHRVLTHDVPCRFCYKSVCPEGHHRCLRGVDVATVEEAVLDLLSGEEDAEPELLAQGRGSRPRH